MLEILRGQIAYIGEQKIGDSGGENGSLVDGATTGQEIVEFLTLLLCHDVYIFGCYFANHYE